MDGKRPRPAGVGGEDGLDAADAQGGGGSPAAKRSREATSTDGGGASTPGGTRGAAPAEPGSGSSGSSADASSGASAALSVVAAGAAAVTAPRVNGTAAAPPAGDAPGAPAAAPAPAGPAPAAAAAAGWRTAFSQRHRRQYWMNVATGESTWTMPSGWTAPAPAAHAGGADAPAAGARRVGADAADERPARASTLSSSGDESRLFALWTAAEVAAARVGLLGDASSAADVAGAAAAHSEWRALAAAHESAGWSHDASARRFVPFSAGIDEPSTEPWWTLRPLAPAYAQHVWAEAAPGAPTRRTYALRLLHPATTAHESTVRFLSRSLLRRWGSTGPARVVVISPQGAAAVTLPSGAPAADVRMPRPGARFGAELNEGLAAALRAAPDFVIVDLRSGALGEAAAPAAAAPVALDDFVPVYPLVLADGLLALTPAQIAQVNGCASSASSPAAALQSLLRRIAAVVGAVLVTPSVSAASGLGASAPQRALAQGVDEGYHASGLRTLVPAAGVTDGRACVIDESLARHVHLCEHGWLSLDTRAALAGALDVVAPRCVVELGSWYGLSTRFMVQRAAATRAAAARGGGGGGGAGSDAAGMGSRASGAAAPPPPLFIWAVDYYKNNAIYENEMHKLKPIDKLFHLHPRWETFAANIVAAGGAGAVATWKGDVYEALPALAAARVEPEVVFIDCEKKTAPLGRMIATIRTQWPAALIVGDDAVFQSVQAAVRATRERHVLLLGEAYLIAPREWPPERFARLVDAVQRIRAGFAPAPPLAAAAAAIARGDVAAALASCAAHGTHALHTPLAASPADTVLHNIARRRVAAEWAAASADAGAWTAPLSNSMKLTPYDYLTHRINFE